MNTLRKPKPLIDNSLSSLLDRYVEGEVGWRAVAREMKIYSYEKFESAIGELGVSPPNPDLFFPAKE